MGVSCARVIKDGEVKGFVGHQNTSDFLMDKIKQDKEEVRDYSSYDGGKEKLNPVFVVFWTPYGGGSFWHGKADLEVGVIVEGKDVHGQTSGDENNRFRERGKLKEAIEHSLHLK